MSFNWENEYRKNVLMVLRNIKTEKPDRTVASLRKECMRLVETAQFPYRPKCPENDFFVTESRAGFNTFDGDQIAKLNEIKKFLLYFQKENHGK